MERALATLDVFAHFCRASGLEGRGGRRGRHERHPRRRERRGASSPRRGERTASADARAEPRGGGALRLPRGGQLDDARPTAACSTSAAARCSSCGVAGRLARAARARGASRHRAHDRALPARQRPGQAPADRGAARPRRAQSSRRPPGCGRRAARRGRRLVGIGGTVRNLAAAVAARRGLPSNGVQGAVIGAEALERAGRAARGAASGRAQRHPGDRAGARGPDPRRGGRRAGGASCRALRRPGDHRGGLREGVFFERLLADRRPVAISRRCSRTCGGRAS